jgi:hypothetical protein
MNLDAWTPYLTLFLTHSPITDTVLDRWQHELSSTIVASSRGYQCEQSDIEIIETIESCVSVIAELARLSPSSRINLCLPHSGLHCWRFMIEHPRVEAFTYIEEGTASSKYRIGDKCLSQLGKIQKETAQCLVKLGYSTESLHRLTETETVFFDCNHKKYLGSIALLESSFEGFPSRVQLEPPTVYQTPVKSVIILFPYLISFSTESELDYWIQRCLNHISKINPDSIAISPHPSNHSHSLYLLEKTKRLAGIRHCMLLSELKREKGIPSFMETGFIKALGFISSSYNSTFYYAESVRNPAIRIIVPNTDLGPCPTANPATHLLI